MNLRPYVIQESRNQSFDFFNVPRVNYDELLDSLKFPIVWSYDELLKAWIPGEIDYATIRYLIELPNDFDETITPQRLYQLRRAGVLDPKERKTEAELVRSMREDLYVKIPQLFNNEYCKGFVYEYFTRNPHLHMRWRDMEGISRASVNNMPLMRLLHQVVERLINTLTGEEIKTSYSFAASYDAGSILPKHRDRPQCVYNISLMIGSDPLNARLSNWPLFIERETDKYVYSAELEAGDAVLYAGTRDLHWRDATPPDMNNVAGVFFHFVRKDFEGSLD